MIIFRIFLAPAPALGEHCNSHTFLEVECFWYLSKYIMKDMVAVKSNVKNIDCVQNIDGGRGRSPPEKY